MGRKPVTTRIPTRIQSDSDEADDRTEGEHETRGDADPEEETTTESETAEVVGGDPKIPAESIPGRIDRVREGDEPVSRDADADDDYGTDTGVPPIDQGDATGMQQSLNILINTIPGEILVLWAALEGAAEMYALPVWAYTLFFVLTAIATPVYVYRSIDNPNEESAESNVRWWQESNVRWQSLSATGAFLVWVYYLGGPFQAAGLQDTSLATVLILIYPVLMVISPYYGSLIMYYLSSSDTKDNNGTAVR